MRKAAVLVLTVFLTFSAAAEAAGFIGRLRGRDSAADGMFPGTGDVPGLEKISKVVTYRGNNFKKYFGDASARYIQYGMQNLKVADYNFGDEDQRVVVEIATMDTVDAASGLFHYHRARTVANEGRPIQAGTEGLIDAGRGGRSVYFYKNNLFVKIIYSGKMPIPDIVPIAQAVDGRIRGGKAEPPQGFDYINVPGVDMSTVAVTPGFTFSIQELPPAVWASAPGGGSTASDLFVITRRGTKEATQVARDYAAWLKFMGENYEEYRRNKQRFYKAVDPKQGRVVFTSYKNAVIIAARPDGYEKGEALIDAVMRKIDSKN